MSTAYLGLVAPELGAEEHVEIERRAIEHGLAHLNDEKLSEMMARSESHNETTGFSFDPLLALATRLERKRRQVEATKSLAGHNWSKKGRFMFATAVQAYEATQAAQLGLFAPAAAQVGEGGDQEHEVCSRITDETVHRLADLIKRRWPTPSAERIAARLLDLESTQVLSQWQEGGWELKGIYFPDRRRCFVSRNYPDKRWRIVADPRATSSGNEGATYPTRESAIRAARCLCATCWLDVLAGRWLALRLSESRKPGQAFE